MLPLSESTSIEAKVRTLKEGCEYCVENQYVPLILETDSLALKKMVKEE